MHTLRQRTFSTLPNSFVIKQSFFGGALSMSNQVHPLPVNRKQRRGLQWALKPILVCMRVSGVTFRFSKDSCPISDWFFALFLFIINVGVNFSSYFLSLFVNNIDFNYGSFNTTTSLNNVISYSNFLFFNIGGHGTVLAIALKWPNVVKTLFKIEKSFQLQQHQYDKLRKRILIALLFFIPVNKYLNKFTRFH